MCTIYVLSSMAHIMSTTHSSAYSSRHIIYVYNLCVIIYGARYAHHSFFKLQDAPPIMTHNL